MRCNNKKEKEVTYHLHYDTVIKGRDGDFRDGFGKFKWSGQGRPYSQLIGVKP